jgi:hypothetical protein
MPVKNNPLTLFIKKDLLKYPLEKGDSGGGCLVTGCPGIQIREISDIDLQGLMTREIAKK